MLLPVFVLIVSAQLAEAKVSFTYASIYGEYDLNSASSISMDACTKDGCSVYVSAPSFSLDSTKNLFISGNDGTNVSLSSLATQYDPTTSEKIGLHLNSSGYSIKNYNKDTVGPIVIYAVGANSPFYGDEQVQINDASNVNKRPFSKNSMTMIMSAEPFSVFVQADANVKAFVRATGFDNNYQRDSKDKCNIIYDHTDGKAFRLRINSPVITVNVDGQSNYQICAKVEDVNGALLDYPGMATSQGYIGCEARNFQTYRSSLYTPSQFEVKHSQEAERSTDLTYVVYSSPLSDKATIRAFSKSGSSSFSAAGNVPDPNNKNAMAYKITVDMPANPASSFWLKYTPKSGVSVPSGQGICGEFYQTTPASTSKASVRPTTSGANGLFIALLPSMLVVFYSWHF